jgi:septum formation protein
VSASGTRPLILASTSVYRRAQLERLGLAVECVAPGVDEASVAADGLAPRALAERLAALKASAVARNRPEATVIGGDQLAEIDGAILGKPGSEEAAVRQLERLAGKTHALITAMAVASGGAIHAHTDVTRLSMRALDRAALTRYVAIDRPLDCAGAYKLESLGIALFERIESEDWSAVTGLPMLALVSILSRLGHALP